MQGIEITYTTPNAPQVVRSLDQAFGDQIELGMGTLTEPAQAQEAQEAGALMLIRMLDEFPSVVEGAAAALEPHRVVFYAQKLAGEFHRVYTRNKCVSDDARLTAARLLLVRAVKQVIGRALALVGVNAPDRM